MFEASCIVFAAFVRRKAMEADPCAIRSRKRDLCASSHSRSRVSKKIEHFVQKGQVCECVDPLPLKRNQINVVVPLFMLEGKHVQDLKRKVEKARKKGLRVVVPFWCLFELEIVQDRLREVDA